MIRKKSIDSGQYGQNFIEFALLLPFLLLVLFGAIDLGRIYYAAIIITNAAREGARFGSINPEMTSSDIATVARAEGLNGGIDLSTSEITRTCDDVFPADGACDSGHAIRVTIKYIFNLIFGGVISLDQIQLVRYVEMYVP